MEQEQNPKKEPVKVLAPALGRGMRKLLAEAFQLFQMTERGPAGGLILGAAYLPQLLGLECKETTSMEEVAARLHEITTEAGLPCSIEVLTSSCYPTAMLVVTTQEFYRVQWNLSNRVTACVALNEEKRAAMLP